MKTRNSMQKLLLGSCVLLLCANAGAQRFTAANGYYICNTDRQDSLLLFGNDSQRWLAHFFTSDGELRLSELFLVAPQTDIMTNLRLVALRNSPSVDTDQNGSSTNRLPYAMASMASSGVLYSVRRSFAGGSSVVGLSANLQPYASSQSLNLSSCSPSYEADSMEAIPLSQVSSFLGTAERHSISVTLTLNASQDNRSRNETRMLGNINSNNSNVRDADIAPLFGAGAIELLNVNAYLGAVRRTNATLQNANGLEATAPIWQMALFIKMHGQRCVHLISNLHPSREIYRIIRPEYQRFSYCGN